MTEGGIELIVRAYGDGMQMGADRLEQKRRPNEQAVIPHFTS